MSIGKQAYPDDWSRDGRFLLYEQPGEGTSSSLWVLPVTGDAKPITYLKSSYYLAHARFSPDGCWVTYASDETGRVEVYVQSFPAGRGKWQISSHGGDQPSWRWDGKELYYIAADRSLVAVPIETGAAFNAGTPANLFAAHVSSNGIQDDRNQYVASHDGRRFLIKTIDERAGQAPITVVVNWMISAALHSNLSTTTHKPILQRSGLVLGRLSASLRFRRYNPWPRFLGR